MSTTSEIQILRVTEPALRWQVSQRDDVLVVDFAGEVDENADFGELKPQLVGEVEFRLAGVTRINSCGVREWVNFVRELPLVTSLRFTHCSPAIVTQLNTIYNFRGRGRVQSLLAPYVCESCSVEEQMLIEVEDRGARGGQSGTMASAEGVPAFRCPRCGANMDFDDLPERYLSFLREM